MSCVTLSIHFYTSITVLEKLNKANLTCVVAGHVKTVWYMEHVIHNLPNICFKNYSQYETVEAKIDKYIK